MEKKRNGALYFWAFIFCMVLVSHYACLLKPGSLKQFPLVFHRGELAILFFFLVAGIMLARHVNALPEDSRFEWMDLWSLIKRVIRQYLPALAIVWIVTFVTVNILYFNDIKELVNNFFASLLEFLPIRNAGFFLRPVTSKTYIGSRIMDQAWVFSAIILALVFLYPLYRKNKKRFELFIAPIAAMLLIGYVLFKDGGLVTDKARSLSANYFFYSFKSTFIALGAICLGVVCRHLGNLMRQKTLSKAKSVLLSATEVCGYLAVMVYMHYYAYFPRYTDLLALVILAVSVTISHSRMGALSGFYDNRLFYFLGRFSLYPFLTFILFAKAVPVLTPGMGLLKQELIYFVLTIAAALLLMALEKPFVKLIKASKKLFVRPQLKPKKETA